MAEIAPYGSWRSPISAEMCARGGVHLFEPMLDGDVAYWLEARPNEDGRHVLMRADPWSDPVDVTPPGFNVRDKVHEYGGGSYAVHDGVVFFANFDDQRVYRLEDLGAVPRPIVPELSALAIAVGHRGGPARGKGRTGARLAHGGHFAH